MTHPVTERRRVVNLQETRLSERRRMNFPLGRIARFFLEHNGELPSRAGIQLYEAGALRPIFPGREYLTPFEIWYVAREIWHLDDERYFIFFSFDCFFRPVVADMKKFGSREGRLYLYQDWSGPRGLNTSYYPTPRTVRLHVMLCDSIISEACARHKRAAANRPFVSP